MPNKKCIYADKQNEDIAVLKQKFNEIKECLDNVITNHLTHISEDINFLREELNSIKQRMAYWMGGIAVLLFFIQLLFKLIK